MSRTLFNRSLNVPAPVRKVSAEPKHTDRPVYIERGPNGTKFFDKSTGERITKEYAVALMRAYKHGGAVEDVGERHPIREQAKRSARRKPVHRVVWTVALYRTDLRSGASKEIASEQGETFLAISTKLAKLCCMHKSDSRSAVEVVIEQVAR